MKIIIFLFNLKGCLVFLELEFCYDQIICKLLLIQPQFGKTKFNCDQTMSSSL